MLEPGDILVDCTGTQLAAARPLVPGVDPTPRRGTRAVPPRVRPGRHVPYGRPYECNEYCKYYKNLENPATSSSRSVQRTTTTATSAT